MKIFRYLKAVSLAAFISLACVVFIHSERNRMPTINTVDHFKLNESCYFENGTLIIEFDSVDTWNRKYVQRALRYADRHNVKNIVLEMTNPGGGIFEMWTILEIIEEYQAKGFYFTAKAYSCIASAAVPIFAVCDWRMMSDMGWLMLHPHSGRDAPFVPHDSIKHMWETWEKRYARIVATHSYFRYTEILDIFHSGGSNQQHWFTAQEAFDKGLVDQIF